ncbi:Hsp20/alpha crystallin family protein [Domibacillus sp. A3M-37]|uniref:Hsp20/alpha crystallin family protein n=1 Tax=Domibacillus sp. A3M-37 TaxID=2962037 RepID=UPI0020B6A202|nr:Hsp20/alpha crystallin family protein [Domibacillus sp. A3M-37]MCP3764703.1 Hsp20/alpha crystallin family protein [Domibacillus sp. A3M-37]
MESDKHKLPNRADGSFNQFINAFDSFFNEPFRQFDDYLNRGSFSVDLHETATDLVVEAKLPGCKKEQIQVEMLRNDRLRIRVENSETTEAKKGENIHYYTKRALEKRGRIIQLPFPTSEEAPKASYQDGLLRIVLKKGKRRLIEID